MFWKKILTTYFICLVPVCFVIMSIDRCRCKKVKLGLETYLKNNYNYGESPWTWALPYSAEWLHNLTCC